MSTPQGMYMEEKHFPSESVRDIIAPELPTSRVPVPNKDPASIIEELRALNIDNTQFGSCEYIYIN